LQDHFGACLRGGRQRARHPELTVAIRKIQDCARSRRAARDRIELENEIVTDSIDSEQKCSAPRVLEPNPQRAGRDAAAELAQKPNIHFAYIISPGAAQYRSFLMLERGVASCWYSFFVTMPRREC